MFQFKDYLMQKVIILGRYFTFIYFLVLGFYLINRYVQNKWFIKMSCVIYHFTLDPYINFSFSTFVLSCSSLTCNFNKEFFLCLWYSFIIIFGIFLYCCCSEFFQCYFSLISLKTIILIKPKNFRSHNKLSST